MRIILLAISLIASSACAKDIDVPSGSAADAKASEAPPATTSIAALSSSFDPDKAAPTPSSSADAGHDHGHQHHAQGPAPTAEPAATEYTCPHHPEVVSDKPGECPKCHMDLVPKKPETKKTDAKPAHDHGAHP